MKTLFTILLTLILTISTFAQTATVISENANLRGTPTEKGKVIDTIAQNASLEILKQRGAWFLVQSTDYVGWMHGNTIKLTSPLTVGTTDDAVYIQPAVPKMTPIQTKPETIITPSSSRTYIRGSRGGCYYINSKGNKTYVERSLCN